MDNPFQIDERKESGIEFPCLKLQPNLDALYKPAASDTHLWGG